MKCKHCGNQLDDDALFCKKCGAKIMEPPPPLRRACPTCGAALDDDSAFCEKCGMRVDTVPAPPPMPPKPVCADCGAEMDEDAWFCEKCGAKVRAVLPPQPPRQQVPSQPANTPPPSRPMERPQYKAEALEEEKQKKERKKKKGRRTVWIMVSIIAVIIIILLLLRQCGACGGSTPSRPTYVKPTKTITATPEVKKNDPNGGVDCPCDGNLETDIADLLVDTTWVDTGRRLPYDGDMRWGDKVVTYEEGVFTDEIFMFTQKDEDVQVRNIDANDYNRYPSTEFHESAIINWNYIHTGAIHDVPAISFDTELSNGHAGYMFYLCDGELYVVDVAYYEENGSWTDMMATSNIRIYECLCYDNTPLRDFVSYWKLIGYKATEDGPMQPIAEGDSHIIEIIDDILDDNEGSVNFGHIDPSEGVVFNSDLTGWHRLEYVTHDSGQVKKAYNYIAVADEGWLPFHFKLWMDDEGHLISVSHDDWGKEPTSEYYVYERTSWEELYGDGETETETPVEEPTPTPTQKPKVYEAPPDPCYGDRVYDIGSYIKNTEWRLTDEIIPFNGDASFLPEGYPQTYYHDSGSRYEFGISPGDNYWYHGDRDPIRFTFYSDDTYLYVESGYYGDHEILTRFHVCGNKLYEVTLLDGMIASNYVVYRLWQTIEFKSDEVGYAFY